MSEEMILTVLNEVLDELKEANKSLAKTTVVVGKLEMRVQAFEQKEIKMESPDLAPVSERIAAECAELRKETTSALEKVAEMVGMQPKPIVRRISFFPENDQQGNYKTFIRWLIGGIICGMIILTCYVLQHEWILHQPREWPAVDMGPAMPPKGFMKPPTPAHKTGEPAKQRGSKKIRKKIDTLEYNLIRTFSDSSANN